VPVKVSLGGNVGLPFQRYTCLQLLERLTVLLGYLRSTSSRSCSSMRISMKGLSKKRFMSCGNDFIQQSVP
jgi:hypothetical protein